MKIESSIRKHSSLEDTYFFELRWPKYKGDLDYLISSEINDINDDEEILRALKATCNMLAKKIKEKNNVKSAIYYNADVNDKQEYTLNGRLHPWEDWSDDEYLNRTLCKPS